MTVPSRVEAARLLLSLDPPAWHVRHSRAVAEIAGWLALRAARAAGPGRAPDRRLVEAAALLHDIDRALPHRASGRRGATRPKAHGAVGAGWLAGRGHPELAEAVALHPVTLLVDEAGAASLGEASVEARLVAYADKRAGQRLEPMADRFARWRRRHPHGWSGDVAGGALRRSQALEADVCGLASCRPEDVARLRWTARAITAARQRTDDRRPATGRA